MNTMTNRPIKIKIDVTKIVKAHLYKGTKGIYFTCAIWPNKSGGTDEYGNTHYIVQEVSKEAREQGEKGPIIGNLIMPEEQMRAPAPKATPVPREPPPSGPGVAEEEDDIPF